MIKRELIHTLVKESDNNLPEKIRNESKKSIKIVQVHNKSKGKHKLINNSEAKKNELYFSETLQNRNCNTNLLNLNYQNLSVKMDNSNETNSVSQESMNIQSKEICFKVNEKSKIKINMNEDKEEQINILQKTIEELKNVNRDLTLKFVKKEEEMKMI